MHASHIHRAIESIISRGAAWNAAYNTREDNFSLTPSSTSLNCRLLCACECTYDINAVTGVFTPGKIYYPAVKYVKTPQPISADNVNACLVGQNSDGIIVAFRGTLPPSLHSALSLRDWLGDFFDVPRMAATGLGKVPGAVHSGFYNAVLSVIGNVAQAVKALDPGATTPVYVTGHSKGGAMAPIAAYLLSQSYHIPVRQVVTFASPRPGDSGFRAGYQAVIPNHTRYENYGDLIPLVAPSHTPVDLLTAIFGRIPRYGADIANLFQRAKDWDYQSVGSLSFVQSSSSHFQIVSTEPLESQILAVLEQVGRDILAFNYSSLASAHTIDCGFGYSRGTCPAGVCDQAV